MQGDAQSCTLEVNCPEKRIWHAHAGTFLAETEGMHEIALHNLSPEPDIEMTCSQI